MSIWTRADDGVKLAVTTWRLAADERREHFDDARPVGHAEMISDIRRGFETAAMIVDDVHNGRHRDLSNPSDAVRWARDQIDEPFKRSLLAAQIEELGRLLDGLGPRAVRTPILETSAIYASLVSDLKLKQDEERRFLIRYREELAALRREIANIKKLLADIRAGRLDENDARSRHRDVVNRLSVAEARCARLEESLLAEAGKPRRPKGTVGPRKPLTPAQATKVAQRDVTRRDRIDDLRASKREAIVKKDRQIADVKARLGR